MAPQSGQNPTDQTTNFFWLLIIIILAVLVFWWADSRLIVIPAFWMRHYEIDAIRVIAKLWIPVATTLHLPLPNIKQLDAVQVYMQQVAPGYVTWHTFSVINVAIGKWTRYPVTFIFLALATLVYFRGSAQFHNSYNMKSLRVVGQEVWPQITPIISLDLVKEDIGKGPWAMCQLPLDFCREHDLLLMKVVNGKKVWTIKHKPVYRLFALQLGPMWKGIDYLPIHVKALTLIFLGRAVGQRPMTNAFLKQIAASASSGKLDFSGVSEGLKAFKDHRIVKWLERRHAYMMTVMATLLEIARSDGVLASAEFLWLKPVDRRLWFVLNNVGRRTSFVEVAGVYAHWVAEKKVGYALKTPMIKGAVDALEEALQNVLFVDEGDRWHDHSHSDA